MLLTGQKQLILACHITGVFDVNRQTSLPEDDYTIVEHWAASLSALKIHGIIFHNNFSKATCQQFANPYISFRRIIYNNLYSPNVYRYFVYQDFLKTHQNIKSLFVTDISDVTVVNNPFLQPLFINNPTALFCGDEPTLLANDWMQNHNAYLRRQLEFFANYETAFAQATLLNCGIIGGSYQIMQPFLAELCAIHKQYNQHNITAYTGDMGAFNYLARTKYNQQLLHGAPVNTIFKTYDAGNKTCWFRHK